MRKIIKQNKIFNFIYKYKESLLMLLVFAISFFLRAYDMDNKYPFGWDQVDNAWAANKIIVNREFPLVGMVAKGNSGFFIGPAYYYFAAFFYWLTDLHPAASRYMALSMSTFSFFLIFFVTKKIFSFQVALLACFINTVASAGFSFDIVQWPVSFLPGVSLLIFYFLYKLLKGEEKYIIFLALLTGATFHLHFTAVFFPIIILLCFPFFPRTKKMFLFSLLSIPLFLIWFIPNLISQLQNNPQLNSLSKYLNTYYHGLHLRRFLQLTGDGLIPFDPFLFFSAIKPFKILIIPIFIFIYLRKHFSKEKIILSYLILIFFLVPWIVFSTYSGEISDYYFSISRFIALLVLSYLFSKLLFARILLVKVVAIMILICYSYINLNIILHYNKGGLNNKIENIKSSYVDSSRRVEFRQGNAESYIYYYLMRKKGVTVY